MGWEPSATTGSTVRLTGFGARLDALSPGGMDAEFDGEAGIFTLYVAGEPASLSEVLPLLHSLGLVVLDEHPHCLVREGAVAWVYEFRVRLEPAAPDADPGLLVEAFRAAWDGLVEVDSFNLLVARAGLSWREAALMRAYARFLKQVGLPFGPAQVVQVLERHAGTTGLLVELFVRLLDPDRASADEAAALEREARAAIEAVSGIDDDRILRAYLALVLATMRTDFFRISGSGRPASTITLKLASRSIPEVPEPRPLHEIFVHGPDVEGAHLRYSRVARGGLRWSDRAEDYRTEVLGLVRAQMVKNAIIVPAGAKGVFVAKGADGASCYRTFVSALLGVTDDLDVTTGEVVPPERVVRRDGDDPYLVVAADRGTAGLSDVANAVAEERGFWLGDAFASGGSTGYDHKTVGITARGAWESVRRHFRELGIEADRDEITVVGIGDMGGDVFGNGMLLSERIRLVAAFDHRHIFIDPDPDPERSHAERARLFALPRSSWADYDPALISAGGGVWPRTAKSVPVSRQAALALGLPAGTTASSSQELIKAILRAPVDLLWNGGIGTYVKAATESHLDVGDKGNDGVRVNAREVRARVVVEGGNLGVTPRGRIELAHAGGVVNSDAWDNSAGVDCSDHEVNIKILLNSVVASGALDRPARDALLAEMTDDVVELVLAENRAQNDLLGTARHRAVELVGVHARLIAHLESRGALARQLEALPGQDELDRRAEEGTGLTSPELATLAAHVKLMMKAELLSSEVLDEDLFAGRLLDYFPAQLRRRFPEAIAQHPLRKEILATVLTNELVDSGGISFAFRISEATGASTADVVRAYAAAYDIFDVAALLREARSAGTTLVANVLTGEVRRLMERATRWLLAQRPQPVAVAAETARYRDAVTALAPRLPGLLVGTDAAIVAGRTAAATALGADPEQAREAMTLLHRFCLLDVVDLARQLEVEPDLAARLYYGLNAHLDVDHLLSAVSALPQRDRWETQARLLLRSDIYRAVRALCADVMAQAGEDHSVEQAIAEWEDANRSRIARSRLILTEIAQVSPASVTTLSVAVRQLASMVSGTHVPLTAGGVHPAPRWTSVA
ncbi:MULTISPECIES: NAD-glutamate dehydrogenase domain-containing protein [Nocardioides]|uniref:NAD-glutamate dehydrogenase domain-containing protein n=1 Tax=Nocardioides vastitatis TaxID=2568655 RepID=A0ABW0ZAX5_9ACTN|nr:NAD-glutamate dehydrogenase domain-containing protein [Nocardioides sp.]THJ13148.1 NAD-glutamate dehydrogenase [Nocardioides sp.]